MSTVHLKRRPDGKYDVPELVEGQDVCHNCVRLALEDHNDIWDQGQLIADRINKVIHLVSEMTAVLKPPDHMNKTLLDDPLMALVSVLFGPTKENSNAQAAEESDSTNF